jgi:16S rRNA (cytosine967-C5)-methyltransferase
MNDYKLIIEILKKVISGANLNEVVNEYKNEVNYPKIKSITYNLIRYYYSIEYFTNKLLTKKNPNLDLIIKVGIYELWLTEKPEYAIINDLVEYTKNEFNGLQGVVNAVLRKFILQKNELANELDKDYKLLYNLPDWLITKIKKQYKKQALDIFKSFMLLPSFGIRINPHKINQTEYLNKLTNQNIDYTIIDDKVVINKAISVQKVPMFNDGYVSIQDIAAQYLIDLINKNNIKFKNVLDACAAPGGKTCQILENYNCILTALEINKSRLKRIQENLDRLNLSAKLINGDATNKKWWDGYKFDFILADVPCSAIGTIKRNPDIKIVRREIDINNFVNIQREIVTNLWDLLSNDGYMVYSTCSILNEENEDNINWFKNSLSKFNLIDEIKILPSANSDGLYYALIKKG